MHGKIAPQFASDQQYVVRFFPLAKCVPSGHLFHIISLPHPETEMPAYRYLSSTMDSEADAWRTAANRLRNLERIRRQMEQNKTIVKGVYPDAFCARNGGRVAQIRRYKRPEDRSLRTCVPISSPYSEEAIAWLDAARKIQSQLGKEPFRLEQNNGRIAQSQLCAGRCE
jgi:hypothetical protein